MHYWKWCAIIQNICFAYAQNSIFCSVELKWFNPTFSTSPTFNLIFNNINPKTLSNLYIDNGYCRRCVCPIKVNLLFKMLTNIIIKAQSAGYFLMYISCISFNAFDLLIFRIIFFYFKLKNILGFSFSSIKLWSISIVISSDSSLLELDFLTSSCTMVSCSMSSNSVSVTELN